jgi:hypothetical protein
VVVKKVELELVAEHFEHEFFTIRKFLDLPFNHDDLHEASCAWCALTVSEATWESNVVLKIDPTAFLLRFLDKFAYEELVARVRAD